MMDSGIYVITHRATGKEYVGRSTRIRNRWRLHKRHTEERRDQSPLHRAMRKYGFDAFDWKVLVTAPARIHVQLEHQFIVDRKTAIPFGYNVGGAAGGRPPREVIAAMGDAERDALLADMRKSADVMVATVAFRRQNDPIYEANFVAQAKRHALAREVARRERLASDPEYAERERARRSAGGVKAAAARKARAATDPAFAEKMHKCAVWSGKKARLNDPRTVAAQERKAKK